MKTFFLGRVRDYWHRWQNRMRSWWWRLLIPGAPKDLRILGEIRIPKTEDLYLGSGVVINEGVYINVRDKIRIGNNTHLSSFVKINAGALDIKDVHRPHIKGPVTIGNNVWLATGVLVNPGVTIHDGVVVGAGAVVTRDLPPYTLCLGIPARPVKDLPRPTQIT